MQERPSRRDFLKLAATASAGFALSSCGVRSTEVLTPTLPSTFAPPTKTPTPTPTPYPTPTPIPNTLRGYADALGIRIGAVAEGAGPHEATMQLMAEQFNQIIITSIGWEVIDQGRQGSYDFSIPDGFCRFAQGNNLTVLGMHLVYGLDLPDYGFVLPDWLKNGRFSRDELIEIMKNHIKQVMRHYRGRVRAYTVVNEATEPSIFWNRRIGREYLEIAFQTAREADPDAILVYNDYAHETPSLYKAKQVFDLVKGLKDRELVDAVGMQMHMVGGSNIDPRTPPTKEELLEQMTRYGELGLKVFITELDVDIRNLPGSLDEKLARQATIFRTVFEACLASSGICSDINTWGVNDIEDSMGEAALLFSDNKPKPAYFAILDALKNSYSAR